MPETASPPRSIGDLRGAPLNGARAAYAPSQSPVKQRAMQAPTEPSLPTIKVGFGDLASFEFTQRAARALAASDMVPERYRAYTFDKKQERWVENPAAIPNCIIALNMSTRLGADTLMVMQNLHIIEGRPSWSSPFVISAINTCGRFNALKYTITDEGQKEITYTTSEWFGPKGHREKVTKTHKITVRNLRCVAWTTEKATGDRIESPPVTTEMAVAEGWYTKNGSKWPTMLDLMICYRAAAFFGRLHAPEVLMGLRTVEESEDIAGTVLDAEQTAPGVWTANDPDATPTQSVADAPRDEEKRAADQKPEAKQEPKPEQVRQSDDGDPEPEDDDAAFGGLE